MGPAFANQLEDWRWKNVWKKAWHRSQTVSSIFLIRSEVWRPNHLCLALI